MVTIASGLSVSAGSATITTTSTGGSSASALVVDASDGSYANGAAVLSVSTATAGDSAFFLFKVRPRGALLFSLLLNLGRGLRGVVVRW